jgi:hypothetical protein
MFFHSYKPASPVSDFVDNLWAYNGFVVPCLRERIFPSGTFELVFNLHDDEIRIYSGPQRNECVRLSGAIASGPYTGFFVTDTALEASIIGVHFKPGGAFRILGVAAHELADRHVDLQMIWGRGIAEIREQLCEGRVTNPRRSDFRKMASFSSRLSAGASSRCTLCARQIV